MTLSEKALEFATKVHAGQFRNDGVTPYIEHCKAVRDLAVDLAKRLIDIYFFGFFENLDRIGAIALVHDSIEDQGVTDEQLRDIGMTRHMIDTVHLLSRNKGESYLDFILRIIKSNNRDAHIVKWADLTHNISDLKPGSLRDKYLLAKYIIEKELGI
jgi:(p)ppGpp synthase/HD superfamily hydrolase